MAASVSDTWKVFATDPVWGAPMGEIRMRTHPEGACEGDWCVVHNQSDHHMREWPIVYRGDKGTVERQCEHGIGHPDPDDLAWHKRDKRSYMGVHGCDGCCVDNGDGEG